MKTKQKSSLDAVKRIVLIAAITMLLIVTAVVLLNDLDFFSEFIHTANVLRPNPFSQDDFTYENGYMTCLAAETWLGVDVSHHQGKIRWDEVADSGVRFAMIRLGHRAVSDGVVRLDTYWQENITGAREAGLLVGVYFYSQAISVEEALEEAAFVLDILNGMPLDFPVVFDWEIFSDNGRNANVSPETVNACALAFCQVVEEAGYQPMVYFNLDLANRFWDLEMLQQQEYPVWLALYRNQMNWKYVPDIWQYTQSGSLPGIDTPVDLNLYFLSE